MAVKIILRKPKAVQLAAPVKPAAKTLADFSISHKLALAARKDYSHDAVAFKRYIEKVAEVEERLVKRPQVAKLLREYAASQITEENGALSFL